MKKQLFKFFTLAVLLFSLAAMTSPAFADQPVSFSGEVAAVEGQRLQIKTDDGRLIWATTSAKILGDAKGRKVSGAYLQGGDIFLLVDLVFNDGQ